MILNILISTINNGIEKISGILLPYRNDVHYIISHQYTEDQFLSIPKELLRDDVTISQIWGKGVTKSRNNAIRQATGNVCVIADDDVIYTNEYFDTILNTYHNYDIDVACFKICKQDGKEDYKSYPKKSIVIHTIQDHSPSSIEITFKRQAILQKGIFFDERFGLGSWLIGGEENLFIHDCIQADLKVAFFPQYIVKHPHDCTIVSVSKYDQKRIRVMGAMDMRLNGKMAYLKSIPRLFKFLPDILKYRKNPISYLWQTWEGIIYIHKNKLRNI